MKLPRRHSQRGFTLLEVLLAIGISLALGAAALTDLRRDNESKQAMAVGQQLETVGKAVNTYQALYYTQIVGLVNVAGVGSSADPGPRTCTPNAGPSPFGGGTSSICTITTDTLVRSGLLPVSFSGRNAFGAQYNIYLRVTGTATPIVDGMVITDTPYTTGGGVRYDLLGQAMQVAGADSGMTRTLANTLEGLNGTWRDEAWPSVTHGGVTYPGLNARGLLGYRSGYGSSGYASYLRLDGTTPMTGDLQMGNNDILDVDNFVGRRAQLKGNANGTDTEILTLREGVDRTAFVAGVGSLSVRNSGGVSFQNLDGTAGANVSTGALTASGSLYVAGSNGTNGDITATNNISAGRDLIVNNVADINNLTVRNGAIISGNSSINGNLAVTGTANASNVVASNGVRVGNYELTGNGLRNTTDPTRTWFYDNTVTAWRTTANVQVDGNTRTGTLTVDGNATMGSLQVTGAGGTAVTPGAACGGVNDQGTLKRTTTGVMAQCINGYWQSNGLQTTIATAEVVANGGFATATATCPTGTKLVGGGYALLFRGGGTSPGIDSESPTASYPNGNGWSVSTGQTHSVGTQFQARAICSY